MEIIPNADKVPENSSVKKIVLIGVAALLLVVLTLFISKFGGGQGKQDINGQIGENPSQNFQSYPTEVPKELILDLQKFDSSKLVRTDKLLTLTLTYVSPNPLSAITKVYRNKLTASGWAVEVSTTTSATVITASKANKQAKYTLTSEADSTKVDFIYTDKIK